MNVWQKKMTIKGRFSDVCFRQKMLSRPKDRSFTPPENLPGEGLKHTFIREKWRFSAFGQNASWAQIYPQNEKTDQKTGRRRILKMVDHFFIFQKNSLHLKQANFSSLKRRSIFTSRKILREKLELHSASKKSLNIAKMVEKRFELPTSTHDLSYEKIRLADCHKIPIFFWQERKSSRARNGGA